MSKPAALVALAVVAGAVVGFLWGRGTRDALSGNTNAAIEGGVLVVRVDAGQAAREGLSSILRF